MNILIVEDDKNLRHGLRDLLTLEGYTVFEADNGQSAIATLQQQQTDFCLLDLMLPDTDGYTLCRQIRAEGMNIPVLMLTARGEEIDRVLGFECGADDYVTKPFSSRELLMRIKAIAKRALKTGNTYETVEEDVFSMGDLSINAQAMCAYRGNNAISLAPRELQLLSCLYQQAGKAVSRDTLYDFCWGREFIPSSRALDQYVAALRQKIEINPSEPEIISTVRGVGYRYSPAHENKVVQHDK
jgi:DNA-binding response OmpR family regulator